MAAYKALYDGTQSDDVQQKVMMAMEKKARTEAAAGSASPERAYARNVLQNPKAYREAVTFAVISQADAANPGDAVIDSALTAVWSLLASTTPSG